MLNRYEQMHLAHEQPLHSMYCCPTHQDTRWISRLPYRIHNPVTYRPSEGATVISWYKILVNFSKNLFSYISRHIYFKTHIFFPSGLHITYQSNQNIKHCNYTIFYLYWNTFYFPFTDVENSGSCILICLRSSR